MFLEQKNLRHLYKKLLGFYPPEFKTQFGESMEQTFNDLCEERKQQRKGLAISFYFWIFAETSAGIIKENVTEIKKGKFMENIFSNQRSASIIGLLLALPLAIILLIEIWDIDPFSNYLRSLTAGADGYQLSDFGKIFLMVIILLLPIGFVISLVPLVRNLRNGFGLMSSPLSFLITAALFIFIARLVISFIIDQYPCWMGVPNCD